MLEDAAVPYCPNRDCPDLLISGIPAEFLPDLTHCSSCNATLVADQPFLPVGSGRHLHPRLGLLAAAVPPGLKLLGAVFGWDDDNVDPLVEWRMIWDSAAFRLSPSARPGRWAASTQHKVAQGGRSLTLFSDTANPVEISVQIGDDSGSTVAGLVGNLKLCGLGFELALLLPPLMWAYGRRRRPSH